MERYKIQTIITETLDEGNAMEDVVSEVIDRRIRNPEHTIKLLEKADKEWKEVRIE